MKIEITNQRFGKLVALRFDHYTNKRNHWIFKCDCGNEKSIRVDQVKNSKTNSCGCYKKTLEYRTKIRLNHGTRKEPGMAALGNLYNKYKSRAKQRGYDFLLTIEIFKELTQKNCNYCGIEPSQIIQRSWLNGSYMFNGIDRVNNSIGYLEENVVPCCKHCNMAKYTMSEEEFKTWINRLIAFNSKKTC